MNAGDIVKKNVVMTPAKIEYKTKRVADRAIFSMSYGLFDEAEAARFHSIGRMSLPS
jgi:hypothetical protein